MLALERENLALVRTGINQAQALAAADDIQQRSRAKGLFPDQIEVARLTLSSSNWASAIEGLAGAAKTTIVGAIRVFAEEHRYTVCGFGMTSGRVKALRKLGINARTIASPARQSITGAHRPGVLDG